MASWQNQAFHKKGFDVSPTRRAQMSQIGYYKKSRKRLREASIGSGHDTNGRHVMGIRFTEFVPEPGFMAASGQKPMSLDT
jgi:hypothetical protein